MDITGYLLSLISVLIIHGTCGRKTESHNKLSAYRSQDKTSNILKQIIRYKTKMKNEILFSVKEEMKKMIHEELTEFYESRPKRDVSNGEKQMPPHEIMERLTHIEEQYKRLEEQIAENTRIIVKYKKDNNNKNEMVLSNMFKLIENDKRVKNVIRHEVESFSRILDPLEEDIKKTKECIDCRKFLNLENKVTSLQGEIDILTSLNLSTFHGPKGDKGDVGAVGPRGPQGLKGELGSVGIPGEKGAEGNRGLKGQAGLPGLNGIKGRDGKKGEVAEKGEKGEHGLSGMKGEQGQKGNTGTVGERGIAGIPGEKGAKGNKGAAGQPGLPGLNGEKGDKGEHGLLGLKGAQGEKGSPGLPGIAGIPGGKGAKGNKGTAGQPGLPGLHGEKGNKGEHGLLGLKGEEGEKGNPGLPGLNGLPGISGMKGPRGLPGPKGAQGIKGNPGIKGSAGSPGLKGAKGERGYTGPTGSKGQKGASGTASARATTTGYQKCEDIEHEVCLLFGKIICRKPMHPWAIKNCAKYCSLCSTGGMMGSYLQSLKA